MIRLRTMNYKVTFPERITLLFLFFLCIFYFSSTSYAEKKMLDHSDLDKWEKVYNHLISPDGLWAVFSVNPQEGDGVLTFYNIKSGKRINIPRGYNANISADSRWGFSLIKPFFKDTRQAKIDKKEGFDLPQDSLAIIDLKTGTVQKIGNIISYKIPVESGDWMAFASCDTSLISKASLDDKKAGKPLVIKNLKSGINKNINWVADYSFSENGEKLAVRIAKSKSDSLATDGVGVVNLPDTSLQLLDRDKIFYGNPVLSRDGKKMAFIASNDSNETGTIKCKLYISELDSSLADPVEITYASKREGPHLAKPHSKDPGILDSLEESWRKNGLEEPLFINQYSTPQFSHNGKRLIFGVAPFVAPDDTTLVDFEKASLDIWRWDAPYTPPMENIMVEELRSHTFPVVYDLESKSKILLTDNPLVKIYEGNRWDGDWALLEDPGENINTLQWDYQFPVNLSVINVLTGEKKDIGNAKNELFEISPCGNFVAWFENRQYHCYNIHKGNKKDISKGIPYPLWQESQDIPLPEKEPYGIAGWTEDDKRILVYDRFDLWSLDPCGEQDPVCLTGGEGRLKNFRMRAITNKPDFRFFVPGTQVVFSLFDYESKKNGFASSILSEKTNIPKIDLLDEFTFYMIRQAKDKNVYSWVQGNFDTSPNVYVCPDLQKGNWVKASDSNPQMKDYRWGKAKLVSWYAYDGSPAEGILYVPEDFNDDTQYPMIAYFYERYTEDFYYHYDFEPSWSWINFPFYVSRGYVVFVPDIRYTIGLPGECAYNYVCSGVEEICRQYPNIDKNRVGIDGQSWGGYQTAYLVTRTNMFACAGSGAPVSNMTSAFGGIRWSTGDSRQAQYEMGQSRIGRNLWEAPQLYIANSPLFYADRVNTPLLIMHNDADGAVPWYQGIEMFMALRRLGKPVWMLEYNGEAHNLKERRNRKDLTIRLQQFFDHYLMSKPMPEWMKKGIPAIRKGQEYGY